MARVAKKVRSRTGPNGERIVVQSRKWTAFYRVPGESRERSRAGYVDRAATEQLATRLEREAARRFEGVVVAPSDRVSLDRIVDNWERDLRSGERTPAHVRLYLFRVRSTIDALGLRSLADINRATAKDAQRWLGSRLEIARRVDGRISAQTYNHWRTALCAFGNWLVSEGYLESHPFNRIERRSVEPNRRLVRRAIRPEELRRLIERTRSSSVSRYGLDGPARAALYLVAAWTGLRASAIASTQRHSFTWGPPTVRVEAVSQKSRKAIEIPLPEWLEPELRPWIEKRPARGPLWPGTWKVEAADMLRKDLLEAEILPFNTRGETFDFHALRGQYATALVESGVSPKVAQELLGHSDIRITLQRYAKADRERIAAELSKVRPS